MLCLYWNHSFIHLSACARWFPYIFGDKGGMDEEQIRNAVQRFKFDRFDPAQEKWEYYIQRFETELALYNLLSGDATAEARKKPSTFKGGAGSV